ncbi:Oxysterol-binding protein-domain-containing protein [Pyronema omphalodes]|nr:Oxysterol-binding protein-domain-containing protein [Pyronema omphalodes]
MVSSLLSGGSSSKAAARTHSRSTSASVSTTNSSQQQLSPTISRNTQSSGSQRTRGDMNDGNESTGSLANSGVLVGGAKSVEETVRTFRLYEALRNGDTAAISKVLRESTTDESRQESMSSLSGAGGKATILHLAVQCAELPVIEFILSSTTSNCNSKEKPHLDINGRDLASGNTPLHIAAQLGRSEVVSLLLKQPMINDAVHNYNNRTPLEMARTPQIFQMLQLARSLFLEDRIDMIHNLVKSKEYDQLKQLLENSRVKGLLDLNNIEPPECPGSTLLHEAAKEKDTQLIQLLLMHGADPFRRDVRGRLPQEVTKDEKTRGVLKKSPAAVAAARGIEERAVLGSAAEHAPPGHHGGGGSGEGTLSNKETREMKGYLKKWTNYTGGYKLRWFVLEDGVLSYYKNQEDTGSACRGAINMRIAKLQIDPGDKERFEIHGKGSVKYHLKANHTVEAKRWFWTLNNAIQHAKDEARAEDKRKKEELEAMDRYREQAQNEETAAESDVVNDLKPPGSSASATPSFSRAKRGSIASEHSALRPKRASMTPSEHSSSRGKRTSILVPHGQFNGGDSSDVGSYPPKSYSVHHEGDLGDDEGDDIEDDASSHGPDAPPTADALALVANSARLQLDLLSQVALALQFEHASNPDLKLGDASVVDAMQSYESAVGSLKQLINDLLSMSKERDSYWRYRMEKEATLRRLWEENMMKLATEQEALEGQVLGERERRKKTKRALKRALQKSGTASRPGGVDHNDEAIEGGVQNLEAKLKEVELNPEGTARINADLEDELSGDSDESAEFFDAIDAGDVEVATEMPTPALKSPPLPEETVDADDESKQLQVGMSLREKKIVAVKTSYTGYDDAPRQKLALDSDDRPKVSLWGILKSMIGKDMTKMTLPVSFNEPTSLLQRVAEDMEYIDLLDIAADRADPAERMVYVAAFAASEYSSTTGRVAKPFNPLLGETFEYVRPDKNYRFFIEQVSHHPPIGAAHAEAEKWDYWGESAVKSKFYGKSFDINPLGTWFLRLRPVTGGEELYTWKKVTTSVIGIITGSPTVDNYGIMEIKNWTTGVTCYLDFKQRGWRIANAYEVKGRVMDPEGTQMWSVGGKWNDKMYARLSPGYDAEVTAPPANSKQGSNPTQAFLIWENNPRPPAPFNLTPFAITLNALPEKLKPYLCPTDTRLRPDQRAMEDGEYDFAATEKNRLEEKQRAKRRVREEEGSHHEPRWFKKATCEITGEEFWAFTDEYWQMRESVSKGGSWERVDDIF